MIFTAVSEHAIRGMTELAARNSPSPVLLDDLVSGTDLPRPFVGKIFQKLVKADILHSVKGRGGGFTLARPAQEISVLNMVDAVEGRKRLDCCVLSRKKCTGRMPCPQHNSYKPIRQWLNDYLRTTTLADLVASLKTTPSYRCIRARQDKSSAKAR